MTNNQYSWDMPATGQAVLHSAGSYTLPRLCDCTRSRLDTHPSTLGACALSALAPQSLSASVPSELRRSLHRCPRCITISVLQCPWCSDAPCTGALLALGALVLWHTKASVPQCLRASVLGRSVLRCHDASEPQRLDAPCLGASPRHVNNMSKFHPCMSCGGMLPPPDKQLLCVQCLDIQHASSAFCTIFRVLNNLRSIPATDPAQQTRGALCGIGSPGLPLCPQVLRRAFPARRIQPIDLAAAQSLLQGGVSRRDTCGRQIISVN
ncbi:UNVERIFIED_CONTAM: hypothetical protein FKN15_025690 [Acipenser sinensis]